MTDFNLKRLAWRARYGKLEAVRMEKGTLTVTPQSEEKLFYKCRCMALRGSAWQKAANAMSPASDAS